MPKLKKAPYGLCECDGVGCCGGFGPVAFEVTRDGKKMKVCTRCDLLTDSSKKLLVKKSDNAEIWMKFDPLGGFIIIGMLGETMNPKRPKKVQPKCECGHSWKWHQCSKVTCRYRSYLCIRKACRAKCLCNRYKQTKRIV